MEVVILLIIIIGSVVLMIRNSERTKEIEYERAIAAKKASREKSGDKTKIGSKAGTSEKKRIVTGTQVAIYTFSAKGTARGCPFCDGENDETATVCEICGQAL